MLSRGAGCEKCSSSRCSSGETFHGGSIRRGGTGDGERLWIAEETEESSFGAHELGVGGDLLEEGVGG